VTRQFASLGSTFTKKSAVAPVKVDTTTKSIHGMSGRKCMLTGKKANNGWTVSFSHIRNKKLQGVNLQYKRVYWPEKQRYIRLRISTSALKSINKLGLEEMAQRVGLDLESLPYTDADPARKEWLVENGAVPTKKNKRAPAPGPKKLFIPKWKEARMAKKGNAATETKAFAERWGMEVA
jgi:large subunit ribosomal protein L28